MTQLSNGQGKHDEIVMPVSLSPDSPPEGERNAVSLREFHDPVLLELTGVCKHFGGLAALSDVSLSRYLP